uniref:Uncharacterized protein LOC100181363 n=1 Tax=Phallusia mammillata TaxID=59560 RepID=A0A6F9DHM5_9ASCI|nr:uncharacterized protein LOC100181363 [Phallusia mammillata]
MFQWKGWCFFYCIAFVFDRVAASFNLTNGYSTLCEWETVTVQLTDDFQPNNLKFRNGFPFDRCRTVTHSNGVSEIKIDISKKQLCGGKITKRGIFTSYRNEIYMWDAQTGALKNVFNVSCLFYGQKPVPVLFNMRRLSVADFGNLEMSLHREETFTSSNLQQDHIVLTSIGQFLYVEIKASELNPLDGAGESSTIVQRCIASHQPDTNDEKSIHNLIENGCPSKNDPTVLVIKNDHRNSIFRWRFQMFKWLNLPMQRIYIFCDVILCKGNSKKSLCNYTDKCPGLPTRWQQRATLQTFDETAESVRLGFGPIFPLKMPFQTGNINFDNSSNIEDKLKFARNTESSDYTKVYISVGVVGGLMFILLVAAVIALLRRNRAASYRTQPNVKHKKETIQPGFAFAITSSNDVQTSNDA